MRGFFLDNWGRKLASLILATIIWFSVNHSLTTTQTLEGVSVRLINLPPGFTVEGLQPSGILSKKISLSLQGNKKFISEINSSDLEVVLDTMNKSGDWMAPITLRNLNSLNSNLDLSKAIKRIATQHLPITFCRLVTEKIPVMISRPLGEAPRDYQFLDIWPSHLHMTVSGPEEVVKQLKAKGVSLTFNLNEIPPETLEEFKTSTAHKTDTIAFEVPSEWKQVIIPPLSDRPLEIDDPAAQELRINFITSDLHPLTKPIVISPFCQPEHSSLFHPDQISFLTSDLIDHSHGLYLLKKPLYAKGVSKLFVEIVQEMLEITVYLSPTSHHHLDWNVQILNPRTLENRYISTLLPDYLETQEDPFLSKKIEEHLRKRFRHYLNQFQLCTSEQPLDLVVDLKGSQIVVQERQDAKF